MENFESGDINRWLQSTDGQWKADTIATLSGNFSLHHTFDNPDSGTDRIGLSISDLHASEGNTRWSFLIRHGYDPSSSNNWSVFLLSDSEPALMSYTLTNGFALGVNLTGYDDTLRLWKVKEGSITSVVNTRLNWQTRVGPADAAKIIVERSADGKWTVWGYNSDGTLLSEGYGTESELFSPGWFGIFYRYSSTRDRLLWFDDLSIDGIFYDDKEAPGVVSCEVTGKNTVRIIFNEKPADQSMIPENFALTENVNRPLSVTKVNDITYLVEFESDLINKVSNHLVMSTLCDNSGNCIQNLSVQFTPIWPETGDVIMSEIMADPLPEVSLPAKEFIEITNITEFSFNLKNWKLLSEDQTFLFPESIIAPHEIRIICLAKDTSLFSVYGKVTGLKQFPALTDGGKMICLSDSTGAIIHGVEYSSEWYGNELKSKGGWSLEIIDTHYPFSYEGNWSASVSRKGGTPGGINSVAHNNPDNSFYGIENVFPDDIMNVTVKFSEPVFSLNHKVSSISIEGTGIIDIVSTDLLYREFNIQVTEPLSFRRSYDLNISGLLTDFAGNNIGRSSFTFGLPEPAEPSDILFNELLFNPFPGDPDYIELYNSSGRIIDASRLHLVSVNDETSATSATVALSDSKRCILPGTYYAVTTDREKIYNRYTYSDPESLFQTGSLPSMPDEKGHLVLYNRELDLIDEVSYDEDMHFSLLSGYEGIALEKIAPENNSGIAANWHSASESSGWGTPGAPNSMFVEVPVPDDNVALSSTRISPDNDGYEDILSIRFSFEGIGNIVTVTVFDETGSFIKNVATNLFIGPEASLVWDGTADDGSPVRTGIYIILITSFDDTGKTNRWKKVCTVIRN